MRRWTWRARNDNGYEPLIDAIARHYGISSTRIATATGCSGANFLGDRGARWPRRPRARRTAGLRPAARRLPARRRRRRALRSAVRGWLSDRRGRRRATAAPRTRLIIVTTPHNPTGTSLTADALGALGALAARVGAMVLVDEVYGDATSLIQNEAATAQSAVSIDGPFVVTNSLTKSYGLAGLRCGWAIASPEVAERIRRIRDVVDNAGPAPSDLLAAHAFSLLPRLAATDEGDSRRECRSRVRVLRRASSPRSGAIAADVSRRSRAWPASPTRDHSSSTSSTATASRSRPARSSNRRRTSGSAWRAIPTRSRRDWTDWRLALAEHR